MTRRLTVRLILAFALLVPVVAGAAPGRLPQTTQVAPSQAGLSLTVDPLDPQHANLVVTSQDGSTMIFDTSSVSMTYAATGLVVDMNGGTFTTNGKNMTPVTGLGRTRLTLKDGKLVKIDYCRPGRNFGQPGCSVGTIGG
jgi:hypothetical protein